MEKSSRAKVHNATKRRHDTWKHIKRKEKIVKNCWASSIDDDRLGHRLAKTKVHCSCPMCNPSVTKGCEYKHTDKLKIESAKNQIKDYHEDE